MRNRYIKGGIFLLVTGLVLTACSEKYHLEQEQMEIDQYLGENGLDVEPTYSGLYYVEIEAGNGSEAKGGDEVKVKYTGMFLDGETFDAGTIAFQLGARQVIAGWDEGINYMREGGKAQLIIPSTLAYGSDGNERIPGYTPLLFDVELQEIY